ncbi:ATP-binding protein [Oceanobacillus senegalensis]|uniref:ATP-binding protein n=1 Tax=Oceanobacillus senegalensis TaxID=1936063 RepID=UPI000A30E8DA|nr:sensor histidine kinase [Oceanobacillus senegalensis]
MRYLTNVRLHVKVLGLIIFLILLIVTLLTITYITMEYWEEINDAENSALQAARTLSYMPNIQEAASSGIDNEEKHIFNQVTGETGATGVLLENTNELVYSNIDDYISNELMEKRLSYQALVFGSAYVKTVRIKNEDYLLGIAPISVQYESYRKIEGAVAVVFEVDEIVKRTISDIETIIIVSIGVLLIGILGGVMLTRSIRKDTLGLEPFEITSLYKKKNAILQSIKEGIIAVDSTGHITMINSSAKQILGIKGKEKGAPLRELFNTTKITDIILSPNQMNDVEIQYNGKTIIVNTMPVLDGKNRIGKVASFRDKTEVKNMINTISEVKQYSEELRAQTHEFTNKLYVLLGLLQLGKHKDAMDFIQEITKIQEINSDIIFNHIQDEKVQAILLGKLAKASENKLDFIIDSNSSLEKLPSKFELVPLLIIISNLIDNAFEAVSDSVEGKVTFFTTDIGNDIILEVSDNGQGIKEEFLPDLFEKGSSEKGGNRGYGLANVKYELDQLGGFIEFDTSKKGTRFTVFLPKN